MSDKVNLREADRRIFSASFEDGLVDIFVSSVVLMFAVAPYLSIFLGDFWSSAVFLPFWGLLFLVLYWIRKNIVKPRSGEVKYGPIRRRKLTWFTGIMLVLNFLFLVLGMIVSFTSDAPGWTSLIPFSAMLLISFSLAGYFLDVTRFYVYGLMLAGGFFVGEWLYQNYNVSHHGFPIVFGISAGIIFLTGLIKLITFMQNNPMPTDENMQWEGKNG